VRHSTSSFATQLADLLEVAIDHPSTRLPDLLAVALTRCPQPEAAAALVGQLPEHSVGLAALAATLASQAVDHHRQLAAARRAKRRNPRRVTARVKLVQPSGDRSPGPGGRIWLELTDDRHGLRGGGFGGRGLAG
jgi:hypothetical protein